MKVTLTYVNPQQKVSPRTGKPYTSLSIKTAEHGDRYLSGFGGRNNADWAPGQTVHITVQEKPNPKGGAPFLNFETLEPSHGELEDRVARIEAHLGLDKAHKLVGLAGNGPAPTEELDDLPF